MEKGSFKKILFIVVIGLAILLSGCTGSQDVTSAVKTLPEVQQFMKEHPNAKLTVTYWAKEEVAKSAQEISQQCEKSITPMAMYKATVSEGDLKIVSWIDAENRTVICSTTEGIQTATPTPTATATQASRVVGFPIDIGLMNGMNVEFIENSREKVAIRFTAKFSGDATSLAINALASGEQHQIRVGIQEDNNGTPKGEWINGYGFGTSEVGGNEGFIIVNLQRAVTIQKGKVYHIVIEPAENITNDKIPILTYMANGLAQPFNNDNLDIVWHDPMMNVLFYDENGWREENKWPIFVVGYSDNNSEGQPYSLAAPWVIHDQVYVGQEFLPSSDYRIEKIAFVVSLKGEPKDKLYYEIRDSNNTIMAKGFFAEKSNLTIWQTWIEATLDSPVTLKKGEIYRIVLLSPGTDLDNAYNVYGHEFSFNTNIGYGGLQDQLTISYDSGSTWLPWEDADTIFKLTTANNVSVI